MIALVRSPIRAPAQTPQCIAAPGASGTPHRVHGFHPAVRLARQKASTRARKRATAAAVSAAGSRGSEPAGEDVWTARDPDGRARDSATLPTRKTIRSMPTPGICSPIAARMRSARKLSWWLQALERVTIVSTPRSILSGRELAATDPPTSSGQRLPMTSAGSAGAPGTGDQPVSESLSDFTRSASGSRPGRARSWLRPGAPASGWR